MFLWCLLDSYLGYSSVRRSHPQRVLIRMFYRGSDSDSLLIVDHVIVVIPEYKLWFSYWVGELAGDGDTVPNINMFLSGPKDGGRWFVNPEPGGQCLDPSMCCCLALVSSLVLDIHCWDLQGPLIPSIRVKQGQSSICGEGLQTIGQYLIVRQSYPGHCLRLNIPHSAMKPYRSTHGHRHVHSGMRIKLWGAR